VGLEESVDSLRRHHLQPSRKALSVVVAAVALVCLLPHLSLAQVTSTPSATIPARDAQAVLLLQRAIAGLAPTQPSDVTAIGNTTIVEGSETTNGTTKIRTRGAAETKVDFQSASKNWSIIFANGEANRVEDSKTSELPLELVASSQSLHFPLPYIAGVLANPDYSLAFVGPETVENTACNHIRVSNTFASQPTLQFLSSFTIADVWLDASTGLPVKIGMTRRYGGGASPRIPISTAYSNYQTVSGVQFPMTIKEYITETLWATTSIQSVNFNTGLSDTDFPISLGGN
jgi:hypothetical protein